MNQATWLTDGSKTFEVPTGSPLHKRLLTEGYEECDDPSATPEPAEEEPEPAEESAPDSKAKAK